MSQAGVLVLDLKRKADLEAALVGVKAGDYAEIHALTPYSAWALQRKGLPHRAMDSWFTPDLFCDLGTRAYGQMDAVFAKTFPAERMLSYYGLYYPLKIFADFLFHESAKVEQFRGKSVEIWTDQRAGSASMASCMANASNLYVAALESSGAKVRVTRFTPKLRPKDRVKTFLKDLGLKRVKTQLELMRDRVRAMGAKAPQSGGTVLARFAYDWAHYREWAESRYRTMSVAELLSKMSRSRKPAGLAVVQDQFMKAFREEFKNLAPEVIAAAEPIFRDEISKYLHAYAFIEAEIDGWIRKLDIRGALGTACSDYEDYLLNYFLKERGKPTVFYQHGGYFLGSPVLEHSEVAPASHNIVFGMGDQEFFETYKAITKATAAGSAVLDSFTPFPQGLNNKTFIYVLDMAGGNANQVGNRWAAPYTDGTRLFDRHRRVIELFAKHPEYTLILKPHPAQFSWCLYMPWEELIAETGATNVRVMSESVPADSYLSSCEYLLLDYACTTLVQALAKDHPKMICYTGQPIVVPPECNRLLKQVMPSPETDDELIAVLESILSGAPFPKGSLEAKARFEALYGRQVGSTSTKERVIRILEAEFR